MKSYIKYFDLCKICNHCMIFQRVWMKHKFDKLVNRTGASGELTQLEQLILRVMKRDKEIVGDTVGSSSSNQGVQVKGNLTSSL